MKSKISDLIRVNEQTEFSRDMFSINLKTLPVTDQKQSGRCWIFAGCNVIREKIAKKYNCKVIIDASQSLGLIDIDLINMQADFVVFAGHKNMYGPFGIGGFYMRKGEKINP